MRWVIVGSLLDVTTFMRYGAGPEPQPPVTVLRAPCEHCAEKQSGLALIRAATKHRARASLGSGDERGGKFLRLVNRHVVTAGKADELPASIVLEARAELLERRRLPADGKYVPALPCRPLTSLLLECRQRLLEALGGGVGDRRFSMGTAPPSIARMTYRLR
jgi:hypothetical protein